MNCLYLTYDGLLDSLGQSQILPYIRDLIEAGHEFTIMSYEKSNRTQEEILTLEKELRELGIAWRRLSFSPGKLKSIGRLVSGVFSLRREIKKKNFDIVHLRGFMPAVMYILSVARLPHLYDFRGFALGEWGDIGKIAPESIAYRLLRLIDCRAVETASGVVVLEETAKTLLTEKYTVAKIPLKVIRTCTDVTLHRQLKDSDFKTQQYPVRFVYLGGARYPYRPDLALTLVSQLMKKGVECRIDFLNEYDHAEINLAAKEICFPRDRMAVRYSNHAKIAESLGGYDCGLIFLDSSPWRRVCSPTKTGEYLAAGLPVISLDGIDILAELSNTTSCVEIITLEEMLPDLKSETVGRLLALIQRPGIGHACQELARSEFSLEKAGELYTELYKEMEMRL